MPEPGTRYDLCRSSSHAVRSVPPGGGGASGRLELVFNFSNIQILNRFRIELAGYQGLVVDEFSSSPDGVIREDLLADLQPSSQSLDGSSGKFSGDWIADFDPRHCSQVRLSASVISRFAFRKRLANTVGRRDSIAVNDRDRQP